MNSNPLITQGAAFDQHSLDKLKLAAENNSPGAMKAAARQMEGLFVQMMLKSMRDASFKGGMLDSEQSSMFTSMYDQQIAQNIASTGKMGFADLFMAQVTGHRPAPTITSSPEVPSGSIPIPLRSTVPFRLAHVSGQKAQDHEDDENHRDSTSFISRLLAPAMAVARHSGIPHQLIIAQAALESGWGNREIPTQSGKPSHNLFGIKATPDWQGKTTQITTTEYKDGVPYKVKGDFKVYASYTEALSDYVALLKNNPRYRNVLQSSSPELAAKALQHAGYATDPGYAKKLIGIINQVKNNLHQAVNAYESDISSLF
ncbi:Peptidoglycan hydrolase FlgJ [Enterobacter sp. DC4]|uniref:flagellar assembly peptidoglycan hydrolase FlgJ n=1 Tax=Enterobacter sp. DC4 TaxID=1395580 RepID=UPI0003ECFD8C|nr:flagellar assembly peptidoglycan hydrolase FlgJ [Enterobacter sp. DC4]EWG67291.1 Peptidoglycan hydrolase FlgJ [Enterobacter sp. DC4]